MCRIILIAVLAMLAANLKATQPKALMEQESKQQLNALVQVNMDMIRSYQNYQLNTSSEMTWGIFLSSISYDRFDEFINMYRSYDSKKDNIDLLYTEFHKNDNIGSDYNNDLITEEHKENRVQLLPQY